jgi:hypothetical protein
MRFSFYMNNPVKTIKEGARMIISNTAGVWDMLSYLVAKCNAPERCIALINHASNFPGSFKAHSCGHELHSCHLLPATCHLPLATLFSHINVVGTILRL